MCRVKIVYGLALGVAYKKKKKLIQWHYCLYWIFMGFIDILVAL